MLQSGASLTSVGVERSSKGFSAFKSRYPLGIGFFFGTMNRSSYDCVPYPSSAHRLTHPEWLRSIGWFHGVNAPDPARAKVLEIGCATGENIFPIAGYYPQCCVLGIDPSQVQINRATEAAKKLNLKNISFDNQLRKEFLGYRTWDYIICHGVFSWVSTEVQNQILSDCKELLSPNGLALISYNVRPGWDLRSALRHLLLRSSNLSDTPSIQILKARELLQSLERLAEQESTPSLYWLNNELNRLKSSPDAYLFHEYLEEHNHAFYISEFVDRVKEVGLRYLSDADLSLDSCVRLPKPLMHENSGSFDSLHSIQLLDVIANRSFRQSVICHSDIPIPSSLPCSRLNNVYLFGDFRIQRDADAYATIVTQKGNSVRSNNKYFNLVIQQLASRYPACTHFQELLDLLCNWARKTPVHKVEDWLSTMLSKLIAQGDVQIRLSDDLFVSQFSSTLRIHPYALSCAQNDFPITNPRHETIPFSEETLRLIKFFGDGRTTSKCENGKQLAGIGDCTEETYQSLLQSLVKYCLLFN